MSAAARVAAATGLLLQPVAHTRSLISSVDVAPEELQMVLCVYSDLSIPQKPGPFKLL